MGPAHGSSSNASTLVKAIDRKARLCLRTIERSLSSPSALEGCEDPSTMTIDFLWARLQAQRAEYKAEKQRTQQLAKRVLELEQKLKSESNMRTRAVIGVYGDESRKYDPCLHSSDREIESEITEESVEGTGVVENVNYFVNDGTCILSPKMHLEGPKLQSSVPYVSEHPVGSHLEVQLEKMRSYDSDQGMRGVTKHIQEAVRQRPDQPDHKESHVIFPEPSGKSVEQQQVLHVEFNDIQRARSKEYTSKELNIESEPDRSQLPSEDSNGLLLHQNIGVIEENSMHIQANSKEFDNGVSLSSEVEHRSYVNSNTPFKFESQKGEVCVDEINMESVEEGNLAKQSTKTRQSGHDHGLCNYLSPRSLGSKMMHHPKLWSGRSIHNQDSVQAAAQTIQGMHLQLERPQMSPYMRNDADIQSLVLPGCMDGMHISNGRMPGLDEQCLPLSCFSSEMKSSFHQNKLIGYRIDSVDRPQGHDYRSMNFGYGAPHIEQTSRARMHLLSHQLYKRCPAYAERMQPPKYIPGTSLPRYVLPSANKQGGFDKQQVAQNDGRQLNTVNDVLTVLDVAKQHVLMCEKAI